MSVAQIIQDQLGYKPFMDGLRAISILVVIAYHVGLTQVPGGFVGVDIFFVISGYLICTHLINSLAQGRFTFGEFWARRAARILPPYLLVITVSMIAAPFILVLPSEYAEFGKQAAYSTVMLANHYFLSLQGYFDSSADTKPLLHLWSLSVEEQFYIVAPVVGFTLFALSNRLHPPYRSYINFAIISALFLLSLYACIQLSGESTEKNYAFFLMALRAWEFIAGASIAFAVPLMKRFPKLLAELSALLGIWLIAYAAVTYSGTSPYPSHRALAPVAGASLIILSGIAHPKILVARVLSIKPMLWIGLVSYAWYLWHWPLLTFGRIYNFGERHLYFDLSMAAISLAFAWATYIFVDRTILKWRNSLAEGLGWKHVGRIIALSLPIGALGVFFSTVVPHSIAKGFTQEQLPTEYLSSGACNLHTSDDARGCLSQAQGRPIGLLIGDSHAGAAYMRLAEYAYQQDTHLATMHSGGCVALLDVQVPNANLERQRRCENGRVNAMRIINSGTLQPSFAILVARWELYMPNHHGASVLNADGSPFSDFHTGFVEKMRATIHTLQSKGVERVLIIGPIPSFPQRAPECVLRADKSRVNRDSHCSLNRAAFERTGAQLTQWLHEAITGDENVKLIDPTNSFCDTTTCRSYNSTAVFYRDTNHLSNAGLDHLHQAFKDEFDWVYSGRSSLTH